MKQGNSYLKVMKQGNSYLKVVKQGRLPIPAYTLVDINP